MNHPHVKKKGVPENIVLSKESAFQEYVFNSSDFEIKINNTLLIIDPEVNWHQLIQQIEIWIHVSACSKNEKATEPVFIYSLPLHLYNYPYNNKPFFQLDKVINKSLFERHTNLENINKFIVKIELYERTLFKEEYKLQAEIVK